MLPVEAVVKSGAKSVTSRSTCHDGLRFVSGSGDVPKYKFAPLSHTLNVRSYCVPDVTLKSAENTTFAQGPGQDGV